MNSPSCCQGTSIDPHTLSYSNSAINILATLLPPGVRLTNFIWPSTSNPKCHVAFPKNNKNECQSTPTFSSKTSPQCHMPIGTCQDDLKLLDDGGEIPKSKGRGWLSDSRLWNLLSTRQKNLPGGQLPHVLWRSPLHPPSQEKKRKKKEKEKLVRINSISNVSINVWCFLLHKNHTTCQTLNKNLPSGQPPPLLSRWPIDPLSQENQGKKEQRKATTRQFNF